MDLNLIGMMRYTLHTLMFWHLQISKHYLSTRRYVILFSMSSFTRLRLLSFAKVILTYMKHMFCLWMDWQLSTRTYCMNVVVVVVALMGCDVEIWLVLFKLRCVCVCVCRIIRRIWVLNSDRNILLSCQRI